MNDGEIAWKTDSERYFARRYPDYDTNEGIAYYTLEGDRIPLAKATCRVCLETVESKRCGDAQRCSCGETFVDTDRWFPERHRYGFSSHVDQDED